MQTIAIAFGGALGAVLRFWTSSAVYSVTGKQFPWGTLAVNVLGSLLMGVLATLVVERVIESPELKNALLIGFLGAFTTFSTFSLDSLNLFYQGHALKAVGYAVISVVACILATWGGATLVRQI
ncbi:MAG: fluoride efflux transporter CrcB [bacterium]